VAAGALASSSSTVALDLRALCLARFLGLPGFTAGASTSTGGSGSAAVGRLGGLGGTNQPSCTVADTDCGQPEERMEAGEGGREGRGGGGGCRRKERRYGPKEPESRLSSGVKGCDHTCRDGAAGAE
jgi:hypothetical protein